MSCSIIVDSMNIKKGNVVDYTNITEIRNLISLNKKVKAEVGLKNTLAHLGEGYYPECDIIWIPLGLFVIKSANIAKSTSGINISLTLNFNFLQHAPQYK